MNTNGSSKLFDIHKEHNHKVSDKWEIYLNVYERVLGSYRNMPINLLEIGIQNGGSLEIWSKYFSKANILIGCDIDRNCLDLQYEDPRIKIVVGDATEKLTKSKILKYANEFDIIIEDASHISNHIIKAFLDYFPLLKENGVFIAEDLHCSYWKEWEGGLYFPYSSMSFFKLLADIINFEHWGINKNITSFLDGFCHEYNLSIDEEIFSHIHSIEFVNSMCIVKKAKPKNNLLGKRYVSGKIANVSNDPLQVKNTLNKAPKQNENFWSTLKKDPREEYLTLLNTIKSKEEKKSVLEKQLQEKVQQLHKKEQKLQEKDQKLQQINKNLQEQLETNQDQQRLINELMGSLSWRVTHPIRVLSQKLKRVKNYLYKKSDQSEHIHHKPMPWDKTLSNSSSVSDKYILIIAELSIPQCKKYRVDQKVEMLEHLGYDVSVVSWNDYFEAKNRLQLASLVIFYRVPAFEQVLDLFREARRLNLTTLYDVDDLIFDKEELKKNKNNKKLDDKVQEEIYNGADLYRLALSNCDHAIASTTILGRYMAKHINGKVFVLPNCIDEELLSFVDTNKNRVDKKSIKIVYGSGTSTHDEDFLEVSNALLKILKRYPQVELVIHGILNLPKSFDAFEKQIKKIPIMSAREYYSSLNSYDINIAPLEKSVFNDAKSNIKFLEASIFKLPTVASIAYEFKDVIENGKNGFVCESEDEWFSALESLILDDKLRDSMGRNAFETVMKRYKIENVSRQYMKPILDNFLPSSKQKKSTKILMVNILFQPISFGGATIVVEELARYINNHDDKEITIFTGFWDSQNRNMNHHDIVRYEANGLPIIGVKFPQPMTKILEYKNDKMKELFVEVLRSTRPKLVHFHSIQQLSASLVQACIEENIPYVITLHDMWWLCEKQFMIMDDGNYCNQEKIDLDWCMTHCSTDRFFTKERFEYLQDMLNQATLLISPSKFQEEMYRVDYISNKNMVVNKNGILLPASNYKKSKNEKVIRFAYMGGKAIHKGYFWLKEIFEDIKESNYKLVLVDLNRKLGANSIEESEWQISGELEISSGYEYSQNGLDEFFKDIDVLLFPSQWRESFGLTVREALVRDVWVITTDAGGVVEDIVDGENGNIVNMDEKEKFKNLIVNFLKEPDFFRNYQNPYKGSIRNFKEQADELAKYYELVLSKDEKTD